MSRWILCGQGDDNVNNRLGRLQTPQFVHCRPAAVQCVRCAQRSSLSFSTQTQKFYLWRRAIFTTYCAIDKNIADKLQRNRKITTFYIYNSLLEEFLHQEGEKVEREKNHVKLDFAHFGMTLTEQTASNTQFYYFSRIVRFDPVPKHTKSIGGHVVAALVEMRCLLPLSRCAPK